MKHLSNVGFHRSFYIDMPDGAHIACDLWLPHGTTDDADLPTILHQTRYHRRQQWHPLAERMGLAAVLDVNSATRYQFVRAGYAWLDMDVRGSGASTGRRVGPWSHAEVADGPRVADWIVKQPWSNGKIGAIGISYGGTCAEMLGTQKHPAIKAIAPRFCLYDIFADVAFPGGLHLGWFTEVWAGFNSLLDRNAYADAVIALVEHNTHAVEQRLLHAGKKLTAPLARFARARPALQAARAALGLASTGVAIPDSHEREDIISNTLFEQAQLEHAANTDVHLRTLTVTYRDDRITPDHGEEGESYTMDEFSPHTYVDDLRKSGAAVMTVSGWHDGGYCNAAVQRFQDLTRGKTDTHHKLVIGPWTHGGKSRIAPEDPTGREIDQVQDLIDFFDLHLRDAGRDVPPVRYFTLGEDRWHTADAWPPPAVREPWYFNAHRGIRRTPPRPALARHALNGSVGTGKSSRWRTLLGMAVPTSYGDLKARDERCMTFTSPPLEENTTVTGHPTVYLRARFDGPDAGIIVYLEDVDPDGFCNYVTEGIVRALHRGPAKADASGMVRRTYLRKDGAPLPIGEDVDLAIDLLAISHRFAAGHRVRVTITGGDPDHFTPVPDSARTIDVVVGGEALSRIELPIVSQESRD